MDNQMCTTHDGTLMQVSQTMQYGTSKTTHKEHDRDVTMSE